MFIKIFTFPIALLFSTPAWADWEAVAERSDGSAIVYLDFDRLSISNKYVYFWQLINFKNLL